MQTTKNTILITGGSSGIGLAMAETFIKAGNEVLICGRRESKLAEAKRNHPQLHTRVCDVAKKAEREELFQWATSEFPHINMLVNNAGIQKEVNFLTGAPELYEDEGEIETNLTASIHLAALFIPHFLQQKTECAIVNITSGLAFIPLKIVPVYCATKAALHSFSISLRSQLAETNVRVFEIAPPIVKTELHREAKARKQAERGIPASDVAEAALKALKNNNYEAIVGQAKSLKGASRIAPGFFHKLLNKVAAG
ncbi:SDR family NAD(P)-dependent oxidoreductase [Fibrisoma montanum]|uniref:SDR family NAD(P)-dependent oxidoreductase n=1 Tax=Fibrisoma montanum TaxID=2305895 RepID=A0A418MBJ0_9BACT|nr:SDR family NAD(P)-dependent oxidoreductase [Fibrisoma montanum]RIV23729.1 SDR family NAD(P)-dependent oxidoreductase [Fibrisoma montanum]